MSHLDSFGVKFGRLILVKRGEEGLTQQALAVAAFGDESKKARISELENGHVARPQQKIVDALTVALNLTLSEMAECRGLNDVQVSEQLLADFGVSRELATSLLISVPESVRGDSDASIREALSAKLDEVKALLLRGSKMHEIDSNWEAGLKSFDQAIAKGQFLTADREIAAIEANELKFRTIPQLQRQKRLRMMRADTALLRGDIAEAYKLYSEAAQLFSNLCREEVIACRCEGYDRLHWHGRKLDGGALVAAQSLIDQNARMFDRHKNAAEWANHCQLTALNLQFIGYRNDGPKGVALLKRAVSLHKRAMSVFDKNTYFEKWLGCLTNYAVANRFLGTRLGKADGVSAIDTAIDSYDEIQAHLPDELELELARTRVNLASSLAQRAAFTDDLILVANLLTRAIECGEYSLSIYEKFEHSRNQAIAHNNLGEAKVERGKRECVDDPVAEIEEGMRHFRCFLTLQPKDLDRVQWGEANENIADAALLLLHSRPFAKQEAIDSYEVALEAYSNSATGYHYNKCRIKLDLIANSG